MSAENTPGAVSYPDDYAAFEAAMQPAGKTDAAAAEENTSEDSKESESAGESETPNDKEQSGEKKPEDDKEGDDDKPESKRGINKRFRELTQKNRRLEAENQQLKAGAKPEVAKPEESAPKGKPTSDQFDDYDDYTEALADWKVEQKLAAREAAQQSKAAEAEFQTVVEKFTERVDAFREEHKDYDEALDSVEDIEFSHELRDVLLGHEKGHEVAYQLAKNRAEAERIAKLPPKAQLFEVGQIVARLSTAAPAPKPQPKASSAPEPIEPSSRPSATRAVRFDDPNVDFAAFEATMNRRQHKR